MKSRIKTILVAAMTLDGKIARSKKEAVDWTSREDKRYFKRITVKAGVVIMGRATFETLKNPLPERLNLIITHNPSKYRAIQQRGILEFTNDLPKKIMDSLAKRGCKTIVVGGGNAVYSLFLRTKLVDEIHLTIAPKIFGGGIPLFSNLDIGEVDCALISMERLGEEEVLVKYRIKK